VVRNRCSSVVRNRCSSVVAQPLLVQ